MRRVLKKLGIGLAIAAAFVAAAEIVARLALGPTARWALDVPYEADDVAGFRVAANVRLGGFTTTSLGTRGREVDPSARERVLVLGDSMTLAAEVDDDETFCAALERELGPGAQVVNAGCPAYGPREELAALVRIAPSVKPTAVVVVFFSGNDIQDAGQDARYSVFGGVLVPAPGPKSPGLLGRLGIWWRAKSGSLGLVRLMRGITGSSDPRAPSAGSHLLGMASPSVRAIVELDDYSRAGTLGADEVARGWPRLAPLFQRMRDAARQFGAPLRGVYLPLPLAFDAATRERVAAHWGVAPSAIDPSRPARKITALFRSLDVPAFDLSDAFAGAPDAPALHQPGDLHLSSRGHALVARELAKALRQGR